MMAVPAVQAETLRAAAIASDALADAVAERTGTDPAVDMYPKLVAAAVMAATTVASQHFVNTPGHDIQELLADALGQVASGLPVPRG